MDRRDFLRRFSALSSAGLAANLDLFPLAAHAQAAPMNTDAARTSVPK